MLCRVVSVMAELQAELLKTNQSKGERWKAIWKTFERRHLELYEREPVGVDNEHFNMCLQLLVLWADKFYTERGAVITEADTEDIMQLELILSIAYLAGKDEEQTKALHTLLGDGQ